jgi:hypothetical protein
MWKVQWCFGMVMVFVLSLAMPFGEFSGTFSAVPRAEAAQPADDLAKEIDQGLRAAEKNMFNGKNEEADKQLATIAVQLESLKALDSQHKNLQSLDSKYERTRKTIDKKLGRTMKAASQQELPKKPAVKAMPAAQPAEQMSAADRKRAMLEQKKQDEAGNSEVQADIDTIIALHGANYAKVEGMTGNNIVFWTVGYGIEEAKKGLVQINEAQGALDAISSEVGRLAEKYNGTDVANYSALSGNIYNSIREQLGANPQGSPDNKLAELIVAGANIGATRTATSEYLAGSAEQSMGAWADQLTDAQLERLHKAKELLAVAAQIDPNSEKVRNLLVQMDEKILQFVDKMEATINSNSWQGDVTDFSGPGTIKELAASAKKYFVEDRDWGGRKDRKIEILAVAVRGPWQVAERDIFGRVIRWRLPIHVAVTDEQLKPRNIARVYDLSIVAMQGSPDKAPQAPPWDGFWVGDNYMMRLDKF